MKEKMVLCGGGGHCRVVIEAIRSANVYEIAGVVDPEIKPGQKVCGISVLGGDEKLEELFRQGVRKAFISVGSVVDCEARKKLYRKIKRIGFDLPCLIHPSAFVADGVKTGEGTFVAASSAVGAGVVTGKNVILNTFSSVDHDCLIDDFAHVAPGAVLSGGVRIGKEAHLGTGARVAQYVTVGARGVVGAGLTLRRDLGDGERYLGQEYSPSLGRGRVFIIAEAGVNHNGDLDTAIRMIDAAASAGADAVKFQTFCAEKLTTASAPKAKYQSEDVGDEKMQLEMLRSLELDPEQHRSLVDHCRKKGIKFISTAYDTESVDMLSELGLDIFKIPSGEITNLPYLRKIGALGKKVILSTGMSNLQEVSEAFEILVAEGTSPDEVTILHCNTEYPTPYEDVNMRAMLVIRDRFGTKVGYSDHTSGIEVAVAAAALGANIIEKHFTLDRNMKGPDHKASLVPEELGNMVRAIRNIEKIMGDGLKKASDSELKNRPLVRKSLVAARDIAKGEVFTGQNITAKRPGTGISPMKWDDVLGKRALRDYKRDDLVEI
ncbi:MAG: N-acetylneuraminate synthase [Candidatus Omnitrophica bacterium]|nr:N-acetylneuraminate synthase [Candidatus Omnitrophota bacterium]